MASALVGLSRRQHAAEEAWARELQEQHAAAHRTRLDGLGAAGAERLARAAAAPGASASMLPSIAAQYLRLSTPREVRTVARGGATLAGRRLALHLQFSLRGQRRLLRAARAEAALALAPAARCRRSGA
jgi:hypothetical protein